jgi:SAM-dependent methyltransferase
MDNRKGVRRGSPAYRLPSRNIAAIYNQAGDDYLAYADGNATRLFCFDGQHAYADRYVWSLLEAKLSGLRAAGATSLSVLDAGCGPGTWLRRVVVHAHRLGFSKISARGFDLALAQIHTARRMARDLAGLPGVSPTFDPHDLLDPLPEADASVDITLCLYSVLSHLPIEALADIAGEFARVTRGSFMTTVRSVGSPPTAFVDSIEQARHLKLDHALDRCEVEFRNGCRVALSFHLFSAAELRDRFSIFFEIEDLCGLDIFCSRFMPDQRWNPASLFVDEQLKSQLSRLEKAHARDPSFMDRATHLLLVGNRRKIADSVSGYPTSQSHTEAAVRFKLTG